MNSLARRHTAIVGALCLCAGLAGLPGSAIAQTPLASFRTPVAVILPLTVGWYDGEPAPYISTEASDPTIARQMGANYVARLASAVGTQAVDDIYTVTNFKQGNIIPSRPKPAGPHNRDPNYTPLWQISMVTWNAGATPYLLTSEKAVLTAVQRGEATLNKTDIVVNCSVVFTPTGGLFPGAKLLNHYRP